MELTKAGFINKASGFNGELQIILQITDPKKLLKHRFLFLSMEGLPVPYLIEEAEVSGDQAIVKLEGINSQNDARALTRKDFYLENIKERKKKTPLTWTELKGYTVIDTDRGELGVIEEVTEYPMHFIASIKTETKEILIPLNEELITDLNTDKKTITLELPEGLLDVYLEE